MKKKIIIGSLILVLLLSGLLFSYKTNQKIHTVTGHQVGSQTYEEILSGIGYVDYDKEVVVKSQVSGEVTSLFTGIARDINEKDALLTINDSDAQAIYDNLKTNLALSKARYTDYMNSFANANASIQSQINIAKSKLQEQLLNRTYLLQDIDTTKLFVANDAALPADLDALYKKLALLDLTIATQKEQIASLTPPPLLNSELNAAIDIAKEQIQQQEDTLKKYTLYAPLKGLVTEVNVEKGEYIQAGQEVMKIASLDNKYVSLDIDEKYFSKITLHQEASLVIAAYPDVTFKGEVTYISPSVNSDTGTISLKIALKEKPELFLKDMSVRVDLKTTSMPNALVVDGTYIIYGEKPFVYQADKKGIVYATEVELYNKNEKQVMITKGLTTESIILDPTGLKEGMQVAVTVKRVDNK